MARPKLVLVACGSGIASSTWVAEEVKKVIQANNLQAKVEKCIIGELPTLASRADIIITTSKYTGPEISVPVINGSSWLTGIGVEQANARLLELLKAE